ncbi:hypothetical protein FHX37_0291 [Haloactinospora alba]|uniref:Molecular chaperone DnaJ n=1 Tax=Haloactinospora alba TaxID=405555 RepID=A0A543NF01_9ACTN|nr:hypothetical protein FHX37_0291 [Haloactinospora alba]
MAGRHGEKKECPVCHGEGDTKITNDGNHERRPCYACGGSGQTPK